MFLKEGEDIKKVPKNFALFESAFLVRNKHRYSLAFIGQHMMESMKSTPAVGVPVYFTIVGKEFIFYPTPDSRFEVKIRYYPSIVEI